MVKRRKLTSKTKGKLRAVAGTLGEGVKKVKETAETKLERRRARKSLEDYRSDEITDQREARKQRAQMEAKREAAKEAREEFIDEYRDTVKENLKERRLEELREREGLKEQRPSRRKERDRGRDSSGRMLDPLASPGGAQSGPRESSGPTLGGAKFEPFGLAERPESEGTDDFFGPPRL